MEAFEILLSVAVDACVVDLGYVLFLLVLPWFFLSFLPRYQTPENELQRSLVKQ
jgi:hypothetical protein